MSLTTKLARNGEKILDNVGPTITSDWYPLINKSRAVGIQVAAIGAGAVGFEATIDGVTSFPIEAKPVGSGTKATSASAAGIWIIDGSGLLGIRCVTDGTAAGVTAWVWSTDGAPGHN